MTTEARLRLLGAVPLECGRRLRVLELPFRWMPDDGPRPRDVCGRRRSVATMPHFRRGLKPGNYGKTYEATPPKPHEVLAILDQCGVSPADKRLRALIAVLWRSGLRINEALDLRLSDVDEDAGTILVRCGKGGKRRLVGMDQFGWDELSWWLWLREKRDYPGDLVFPIVEGHTTGRKLGASYVRARLKQLAADAGIKTRVAPHQLRHALACDLAREGVPLHLISRQLGHSNIATTTTYLSGIAPVEITTAMLSRPSPDGSAVSASSGAEDGVGEPVMAPATLGRSTLDAHTGTQEPQP